jgi:diguanylate cyclase (GGDEF)-like protein/PAS domain S-box-containing protein
VTDAKRPSSARPIGNFAGEGLSERLSFLLSESDFGTWDLEIKSGDVVIDERWAQMLGYTLAELEPITFEKFASMVHPEDWEHTQASVTEQIAGAGLPFNYVFRMQHKDGSWRWIRTRGKVTKYSPDGEPLLLTGINEDITDTRRRNLELLVSRQQLQSAQRIAGIGSWFLDLGTDAVTWSEELFLMQGLDPNEPAPPASTHAQLFDAESWERLAQALEAVRTMGTPYELELRMEREGKFYGWMLVRGEAVRDAQDEIIAIQGVALDISDRKQTESKLQRQATLDSLTGLGNRASMNQEIEHALGAATRRGSWVGCLMVDIDNFKGINDLYGHAVGDAVLREAASRLSETTRGSDSVFRPGGDEFLILLPNVRSAVIAEEVAGRILEVFRQPMVMDGKEIECTVSIGGSISDGSENVSELLREADSAMYAAKRQGRDDYVFFDHRQQLALVERLALETQMREGVDKNQFVVHYQPIVDLNSGKIRGAEALLRWHQPSGDVLDAKEFIRVAEETGLLRRLGAFSLREACHAAALWLDMGLREMHVNISASQLSEPTFLHILDNALTSAGLDPSSLCLEITESTLLREANVVRANITGIHERGVRLALDDFGTGYAALSYLMEFPITILKLDRIFVRSTVVSQSDYRVVKGSLVLARALELESIAEGVEDAEVMRQLRDLGCELGQGNYLSPPLDLEGFTALVRQAPSLVP